VSTAKVATLAELYAGEALGIEWPAGTSPSVIGRRLILRDNRRYGWYHQPPAIHYKELPALAEAGIIAGSGAGLDPYWRRLPTDAERAGCPMAHVYDRNGSYLSVAGSAALPCGVPEWVSDAVYQKEPGKSAPAGLWRVEVLMRAAWDGYDLPAVCGLGEQWLWTSTLRCALECGYVVRYSGAILWPEQHKVLGTWAQHLWMSRRELETNGGSPELPYGERFPVEQARREALALVKGIYAQTIGLFGMTPRANEPPTAEEIAAGVDPTDVDLPRWRRPEWQRTIKADAAARMFYYARKVVANGSPPLWLAADSFGFPGWDSAMVCAGAAGLNTTDNQCGAMRHVYSIGMEQLLDASGRNVVVDGRGHKLPGVRVRQ
jgi:hypothetical protein